MFWVYVFTVMCIFFHYLRVWPFYTLKKVYCKTVYPIVLATACICHVHNNCFKLIFEILNLNLLLGVISLHVCLCSMPGALRSQKKA